MKRILYLIFSMSFLLVNNIVLSEPDQHCFNRSSGSEKGCLAERIEGEGNLGNSKINVLAQLREN
ncbi:MAG: hypothetical protein ACU83O_07975, partial [Gammaproteobacteria bacterium]